jgi:hypothetical protein
MQKAIVALALAVLEIIDIVWGENVLSHLTEESIGVIIAALFPILIWFTPNRPT